MPSRPAAAPAREPGKGALLSIGQVLAKLSPEFPDLTPSKLRFLEEQQLVAPDRTESGYRKFSPRDVDRRWSREELLHESGASAGLLNDAVSASLVPASETFGEDALAVVRALVELQRSGIEPRHLRGFRAAAERELGLIESALVPVSRRNDPSSRAKAAELAREIAGQLEIVRSSLIRSALGRLQS